MNSASLSRSQFSRIYDPGVQAVMYAFLLVATPFVLLRNYLVQAISYLSSSSFDLLGLSIKIVPIVAILGLLLLLWSIRKRLNKLTLLAFVLVIVLDTLAQQVTDYYFGHKFYDLQQNWHYLAYGIYSFMVYRALESRKIPIYRIMLITYLSALGFSLFDEFFQMFLSSRVFDICDIGKDVWGVLMGMIIVYFSGRHSRTFFKDWRKIRHASFKQYYKHPVTLLIVLLAFTFLFLNVGSLLTEAEYAILAALITIVVFAFIFIAYHISQYRIGKIILLAVLISGLAAQTISYIKYRDDNVVYNRYGLTVYKGIPIPFFDIMIYSNGTFRLVDKKHFFNQRDREFLLRQKTDIILIGSGADGAGGKGFSDTKSLFSFNKWAEKGTQVIILKTPEAADKFNKLKSENKNIIFIIHNTC